LRFVLDHDVDARVAALLRRAGHECWTVGDAGLALASDDDVSVYCDNQKAILITHDVDLVRRRRMMPFGHVLHLRCREPEARDVLSNHMDTIVNQIGQRQESILRVSSDAVTELSPQSARSRNRRRTRKA
jgi:predicted nuclease of predicted toxin-antitoxin system